MASESILIKKWMGQTIEKWAGDNGFQFRSEYKFHPKRKWRFDWAIPGPMIQVGIEYEGIFSTKSRHTSLTGFSADCEKYTLAAIEGWKVLRYTILNYRNLSNDLQCLLKQN